MTFMFYSATKANPNVSKWDTSKVTDMRSMFYGATSANPDVSKLNINLLSHIHLEHLNANSTPKV